MNSFKIRLYFSTVIVVLFTMILSNVVFAGNYFNGGLKDGGYYYGVKGNIECDPVYVSSNGDVCAWIMLAGSGSTDYLQAGWGRRYYQTSNYHFFEWSSSEGYGWGYASTASTGTHSYEINKSGSNWYVYVNGNNVSTISTLDIPWTAVEAQFFGETYNTSDQNPGSVSNPITMGYLKVKNSSGVWSNASLTYTHNSLSTQSNNADVGDTTFEQWDTRY